MTTPAPFVENIVTTSLVAEFRRMRNKLDAAGKRLHHAQSLVVHESAMLEEHQRDLDMLADAIISNGGLLPPDDSRDAMNPEPTP
jgi:hypothetical protein